MTAKIEFIELPYNRVHSKKNLLVKNYFPKSEFWNEIEQGYTNS